MMGLAAAVPVKMEEYRLCILYEGLQCIPFQNSKAMGEQSVRSAELVCL
jgi:hypothetical protein